MPNKSPEPLMEVLSGSILLNFGSLTTTKSFI